MRGDRSVDAHIGKVDVKELLLFIAGEHIENQVGFTAVARTF